MRTLYYVPMLHMRRETPVNDLPVSPDEKFSSDEVLTSYWRDVKLTIDRLIAANQLRPAELCMFEDGLPVSPQDDPQDSWIGVDQTTPIWLIKQWLHGQGAILHGTENIALVYGNFKLLSDPDIPNGVGNWMQRSFTAFRDEFVAKRINEKLSANGTAILFMGAAHRVDQRLAQYAPDIEIRYILSFAPLMDIRELRNIVRLCMRKKHSIVPAL